MKVLSSEASAFVESHDMIPGDELIGRSVAELRRLFLDQETTCPPKLIAQLEGDSRSGVREIARLLKKRRCASRREEGRLRNLLRYEGELWDAGLNFVAGLDEAGMAPLAGPVVAAAVILPKGYRLAGLNDSKKIPEAAKREQLAARIKTDAVCWAVGRAEVEEIDRLNIYHAGLLAMRRAVGNLTISPEYLLVDARTVPQCTVPQRGIVHGDALSASIAAASIIAKTTRDALMTAFDEMYRGYNFASHKGYPTPEHCRLLKQLGVLPIHRRSFGPVREALGLAPSQSKLFDM
jgi:ribonuclease HII